MSYAHLPLLPLLPPLPLLLNPTTSDHQPAQTLISSRSLPGGPLKDEPRNHPLFLILIAIAAVGAVPFWFVGRETVFVLGLPVWLWSSLAFAVGLSAVSVWGILKLWRDDELD